MYFDNTSLVPKKPSTQTISSRFPFCHCAISICQNVRYAMNVTAENVCDLVILGAMNFHGAWFFILVATIVWQLTYAMLFPKSVVRKRNVYVFFKRTRFFCFFPFIYKRSSYLVKRLSSLLKSSLYFPPLYFCFFSLVYILF